MDFWNLKEEADGYSGDCVTGLAGRVFGGHTLSHSVTAAALALHRSRQPSSLHALFLAPGNPEARALFTPKVLKRGRSLDNVRVEVSQGDRQILEALVSFHIDEPSIEFSPASPCAPSPAEVATEELPDAVSARSPFEVKPVAAPVDGGLHQTWIRLREPFDDFPDFMHATMLTYAIDFLISRSGRARLGPDNDEYAGASLDHAMWFHRPFRADEWLLVEVGSTNYSDSRAHCTAEVYTEAGVLVASAAQEVLFRLTS